MEINLDDTDVREKAFSHFESICKKEGDTVDYASNLIRTLIQTISESKEQTM